ncbi:MAG TPA: site-specific DNA-methyltransferase [Acidimicrobiia bacterium]
MSEATILVGDVRDSLRGLPDGCVRTVVTSPPYWGLRDYGHDGQIGLEQTPDEYVAEMVGVFREVRRVLADDGTVWLNLGDSYGSGKQLVGIPWRVAFALQADGWYLRQDIIWAKPNPMPESVTDRCTKAHEYVFLLTKQPRYYYDHEAVSEPAVCISGTVRFSNRRAVGGMKVVATGNEGRRSNEQDARKSTRNRRSVWTVTTKPFKGAHFAVMPEALVEPCVLAGSAVGDTVLDPFSGSGTVGVVALRHSRNYIGCELNPDYAALSEARIRDDQPLLNAVDVR